MIERTWHGRRGRVAIPILAAALIGLAAASAIQVAPAGAGEPIGDAVYKGKARGDGRKVELTTSPNGRIIGELAVRFDARCRQGGKNYTNKNTGLSFYRVKVRPSGKFKAKEGVKYPGGWRKSIARGRFSEDGKAVRGRFSFDGGSSSTAGSVKCSARARFRARTKAKPKPDGGGGSAGSLKGEWVGTTGQGLEIEFYVARDEGENAIRGIRFDAQVECVPEDDAAGSPAFTETYRGGIFRGHIEGDNFRGAEDSDQVTGRFEGETASGVLSVTNYRDGLGVSTCSTPGEIPFTARRQ